MSTEPASGQPGEPALPQRAGFRRRLAEIGVDPDYRFTLANERTFLAWIRTSLALIAGGVAVVELAPALGNRWIRLTLGCVLIAFSAAMAAASHRRWYLNERAMRLQQQLRPTRLTMVLGYGVAVIAVAVFVVLLAGGG
jgi:putative membrane protein